MTVSEIVGGGALLMVVWHGLGFVGTRLHMYLNQRHAPTPLFSLPSPIDEDERLKRMYDQAEEMMRDAQRRFKEGDEWREGDK